MKKPTPVHAMSVSPSKDVSLTIRNLQIADNRTKVRIRLSGGERLEIPQARLAVADAVRTSECHLEG